MTSLLDDVNELLRQRRGDLGRLNHIKEALEENEQLYVSDRQYLTDLTKKYIEKSPEMTKSTREQLWHSNKSDEMLHSENENMSDDTSDPKTKPVNKRFCINCGSTMSESTQFCINCGKSPNAFMQTNVSSHQPYPTKTAGRIWYLLPIFLGLVGGIIAWAIIRKRNRKRSRNILILGIIFGVIQYGWVAILLLISFHASDGTSEIDNALSEFPEQIRNIKQMQILDCENNMGYLQSFELGEMIKERCINGILGK